MLRSISKQSFSDIEVLLVPDEGVNLHEKGQNVIILPLPVKSGASNARNHAARFATGDILAFLDDDVTLDEEWCQQAIATFRDSSIGAVSGCALVNLKAYSMDYIPKELEWVVGGTYWSSSEQTDVFSGAGMNFCVLRDAFFDVGGYDSNLGPRGDRPETADWRRLGGEEQELAIKILAETGLRVVYNPRMIVIHRLRRDTVTIGGLLRRALHVGHNRAFIHTSLTDVRRKHTDYMVSTNLLLTLSESLLLFPTNPLYYWKRFSFSILVLGAVFIGFLVGKSEFRGRYARVV